MKFREKLSTRLGFLLVSVGCAVGVGNVWRFPYITGQNGGAAFVFLYIIFLFILGLPVLIMEFSIGRAGEKNLATSYKVLKPKSKWPYMGYVQMLGNILLLAFYTTVAGWCLYYFASMLGGKLEGMSAEQVGGFFGSTLANGGVLVFWMGASLAISTVICAIGLKNGIERATKFMMISLFVILIILVVRAVTLKNAIEGVKFYLVPDFDKLFGGGIRNFGRIMYEAIGQAFFTLSLGVGSMAIFGSYIKKENRLAGESIAIVGLDTLVALMSGLIIFPACFSFGVNPGSGAGLTFVTLPNIFNDMAFGRFWGTLFFLFLSMAALTTVIAVMENIIALFMDEFGIGRKKTALGVGIGLFLLGLPTALGFSVLSGFQPFGEGSVVLDLLDFIVSKNILPLGGLVIVFFCTLKIGWGWDNFVKEANTGKGIMLSPKFKFYCKYILPVIIMIIFVMGYADMFIKK